jgi:formylglycine-generating enzyme required for sulfatase activity
MDDQALTQGSCPMRVMRDGSWRDEPWVTRSAIRNGTEPGLRNDLIGFRVARTLNPMMLDRFTAYQASTGILW